MKRWRLLTIRDEKLFEDEDYSIISIEKRNMYDYECMQYMYRYMDFAYRYQLDDV